jgi:HAD superfamily hydrolase (TIGR01549 family)
VSPSAYTGLVYRMGLYTGSVRAVFLDAGNTLLRIDYAVIATELARHGVHARPDEVQRAEWRARVRLDDEVLAKSGPGATTESGVVATSYLRFVLEGLGVTDETTIEKVAEWRREYNRPVGFWNSREPQAPEALALLRRSGLRAAVISNSNGSIQSILSTLGLLEHLDFVLDSAEVGVEKPNPKIFQLALRRAGVAPTDAAYVGDLYSVDVRGARAAGMRAVLLDPGGHWGARDCPMAPDLLGAIRAILSWRS